MTAVASRGFAISSAVRTDVGRVRDNNEDSFGLQWLTDETLFLMVADGMGGHEAGEVASNLAVNVVQAAVSREMDRDPRQRLHDGLLEANEAIVSEGKSNGVRGMGTTAVVILLSGPSVWVGQVGDSRVYQFRKGRRVFRTRDHTRVQTLVDAGVLGEHEVRTHPEAGMLTRALGHPRMSDGRPLQPEVQGAPLHLEPEDVLVLSSDGLHDLVDDDEIGRLVSDSTPEEAAERLVQLACDRGGHDNVTVAVVVAGDRSAPFDAGFMPFALVEDAEDRLDHPAEVTFNDTAAHLDEYRSEARAAREAGLTAASAPEPMSSAPADGAGEQPVEPSGRVALGVAAAAVVAVVLLGISSVLGLFAWWYWS